MKYFDILSKCLENKDIDVNNFFISKRIQLKTLQNAVFQKFSFIRPLWVEKMKNDSLHQYNGWTDAFGVQTPIPNVLYLEPLSLKEKKNKKHFFHDIQDFPDIDFSSLPEEEKFVFENDLNILMAADFETMSVSVSKKTVDENVEKFSQKPFKKYSTNNFENIENLLEKKRGRKKKIVGFDASRLALPLLHAYKIEDENEKKKKKKFMKGEQRFQIRIFFEIFKKLWMKKKELKIILFLMKKKSFNLILLLHLKKLKNK